MAKPRLPKLKAPSPMMADNQLQGMPPMRDHHAVPPAPGSPAQAKAQLDPGEPDLDDQGDVNDILPKKPKKPKAPKMPKLPGMIGPDGPAAPPAMPKAGGPVSSTDQLRALFKQKFGGLKG